MVIEMAGPRHRDSSKTTTISMDPAVLKPLLGSNIKRDYFMLSTNQGSLAEGEGLVPLTSWYPLELISSFFILNILLTFFNKTRYLNEEFNGRESTINRSLDGSIYPG